MNIGIIGLGLIGGSLIKKLHSSCDVTGYDLAEDVRQKAKQAGFRVRNTLNDLLQNSEIVIIASPTNSALEILKEIIKMHPMIQKFKVTMKHQNIWQIILHIILFHHQIKQ